MFDYELMPKCKRTAALGGNSSVHEQLPFLWNQGQSRCRHNGQKFPGKNSE
jgi:hypothetical protein